MEAFADNLLRLVRQDTTLDEHPELRAVLPHLEHGDWNRVRFSVQDEFIRLFPLCDGPGSLEIDWLDLYVGCLCSELEYTESENFAKFLESKTSW